MYIEPYLFSKVIEHTPLVSIDLIIRNREGQVLLGQRINKPAQGDWFVPGGRILKNEFLSEAFKRLTLQELGKEFAIEQANLLGHYEHFYNDNVFGDDFSTHYVVIAYFIEVEHFMLNLPVGKQHLGYEWFNIIDLLENDLVNKYTKDYFN
jgi:colanic acid biosynthesis protein WcaH